MSKEVELHRFRQLIARAAQTGENLGVELQEQRRRLEALGATAGEINEAIHDRHNRGEYRPRYAQRNQLRHAQAEYQPHRVSQDTPLKVPFADKDQAKALGARWDASRKVWFAPAGTDLKKFSRWLR